MEVDQFIEDGSNVDSLIRKDMMKSSRYSYMAGDHGLTINQGCLAILSTCVGGGIVGVRLLYHCVEVGDCRWHVRVKVFRSK